MTTLAAKQLAEPLGLTWMDNSGGEKDLTDCVKAVCKAYKRRLGHSPNIILVHSDLVPKKMICNGVRLIPQRGILLHHYHAIYKKGRKRAT